jgi:hypothetical protein
VGNYAFEFVSVDGGTTVWVFDNSRPADVFGAAVSITANTVSTSATTGALRVAGGVGISGNLYVAGNIVGASLLYDNVNVTGNVTGNVLVGNAGVIPSITVNSLSSDDSSFVTVQDGLNVQGDVAFNGNLIFSDLSVQSTAYAVVAVPANSSGQPGDRAGMVAFSSAFFYFCETDYTTGGTQIWQRIATDATAW